MKYTTTAVVNLTSGTLELSNDQARRRMHALEKVSCGKYLIKSLVQFKAGETFGYDGVIPKDAAEGVLIAGKDVTVAEINAKEKERKKLKAAKEEAKAKAEAKEKEEAEAKAKEEEEAKADAENQIQNQSGDEQEAD